MSWRKMWTFVSWGAFFVASCQSTARPAAVGAVDVRCQLLATDLGPELLSLSCDFRNTSSAPVMLVVSSVNLPDSGASVIDSEDFKRELSARGKGHALPIMLFGSGLAASEGPRGSRVLALPVALGVVATLFLVGDEEKPEGYGRESLLGTREALPPGTAVTKYLLARRASSSIPERVKLCFALPTETCVIVESEVDAGVRRMRPVAP